MAACLDETAFGEIDTEDEDLSLLLAICCIGLGRVSEEYHLDWGVVVVMLLLPSSVEVGKIQSE